MVLGAHLVFVVVHVAHGAVFVCYEWFTGDPMLVLVERNRVRFRVRLGSGWSELEIVGYCLLRMVHR